MTVATESNSFILKRHMQGKGANLLEMKGNEGQPGGPDEFMLLQYEDLRKSVRDLEKQVSFLRIHCITNRIETENIAWDRVFDCYCALFFMKMSFLESLSLPHASLARQRS